MTQYKSMPVMRLLCHFIQSLKRNKKITFIFALTITLSCYKCLASDTPNDSGDSNRDKGYYTYLPCKQFSKPDYTSSLKKYAFRMPTILDMDLERWENFRNPECKTGIPSPSELLSSLRDRLPTDEGILIELAKKATSMKQSKIANQLEYTTALLCCSELQQKKTTECHKSYLENGEDPNKIPSGFQQYCQSEYIKARDELNERLTSMRVALAAQHLEDSDQPHIEMAMLSKVSLDHNLPMIAPLFADGGWRSFSKSLRPLTNEEVDLLKKGELSSTKNRYTKHLGSVNGRDLEKSKMLYSVLINTTPILTKFQDASVTDKNFESALRETLESQKKQIQDKDQQKVSPKVFLMSQSFVAEAISQLSPDKQEKSCELAEFYRVSLDKSLNLASQLPVAALGVRALSKGISASSGNRLGAISKASMGPVASAAFSASALADLTAAYMKSNACNSVPMQESIEVLLVGDCNQQLAIEKMEESQLSLALGAGSLLVPPAARKAITLIRPLFKK